MTTIRVAWGTGRGPTATAAYDAALAAAGVGDYNLVVLSSVVPAGASVEEVETAQGLGPVGGRLSVVEAHAAVAGPGRVAASLGWATGPEGGVFYEAAGEAAPGGVEAEVRDGLAAGLALRDWPVETERYRTVEADGVAGEHTAAVVVAAYGRAEPFPEEPF